jgi:hypothetical protein
MDRDPGAGLGCGDGRLVPPRPHCIGGWDYDSWRGTFYPPGLLKTKQLRFAAAQLSAVEINATFYKLQRPELFERWAADVPDGFVFTVKASRFCTNRKVLADAGEAIARFCGQGFTRLGRNSGPSYGSSPRPRGSMRTMSRPSWPCSRPSRTAFRSAT